MSSEPGTGKGAIGSGPVGEGPFDEDLHHTRWRAWVAVAMMVTGAALLAGAVVALAYSNGVALGLAIAGAVVGVFGMVVALRSHIMEDTS